jgi:hypothetical protein
MIGVDPGVFLQQCLIMSESPQRDELDGRECSWILSLVSESLKDLSKSHQLHHEPGLNGQEQIEIVLSDVPFFLITRTTDNRAVTP